MRQSLLLEMCGNRNGRDGRRKKVYRMPWIEIQQKVTPFFPVLLLTTWQKKKQSTWTKKKQSTLINVLT